MSHALPSLRGLRAFEAAGRHASFALAARELFVTAGAISQQIRDLEEELGVPLFQRSHRRVSLTPHGEALLTSVAAAFESMSAAVEAIAVALPSKILRLGVSPRLTADPLRLLADLSADAGAPAFVRVTATDDVNDLLNGSLDAILRPGPGPYPGMQVETLVLKPAFAPSTHAVLVVWPGLARCAEVMKVRAWLTPAVA